MQRPEKSGSESEFSSWERLCQPSPPPLLSSTFPSVSSPACWPEAGTWLILTVTGEQHYAAVCLRGPGGAAPLMVAHEISLISASLITSKSSFNEKEKSGLYKLPERDHMTPILYSPHWLPAQFRVQFNFSKSLFEMTTTFKWPSGGHNTRPEDTWYSCGRTTSAAVFARTWLQNCTFGEQEKKNTQSWSIWVREREVISARGGIITQVFRSAQIWTKFSGRRRRRSSELNYIQLKLGEKIRIRANQLHHTLPRCFGCWRRSSFWAFSGASAVLSSVSTIWLQPFIAWENLSPTWNMGAGKQGTNLESGV